MAPNLYRFFKYTNIGKSGDVSYDAAMRLMRNDRCNWQGMLLKLSTFCCSFISTLKTDNINCLVADDSMIERPRGKRVELLSRQFNHVSGRHVKGFANLSSGWTDGISFIPVLNQLMASSVLIRDPGKADGRSYSARARRYATMSKPDVLVRVCKRALNAGIKAQCLLLDSWFFSDNLLSEMSKLGPGVISLVRNIKFAPEKDSLLPSVLFVNVVSLYGFQINRR